MLVDWDLGPWVQQCRDIPIACFLIIFSSCELYWAGVEIFLLKAWKVVNPSASLPLPYLYFCHFFLIYPIFNVVSPCVILTLRHLRFNRPPSPKSSLPCGDLENSGSSTTSHWRLDQREGSCQEGCIPAVGGLEFTSDCSSPGPRCRTHSEIWKGGGFPPWHRTSNFLFSSLSHLAPRLYTWPSHTGSGEPSSRGVSYKERLPEILQCLGLNKHFLGVSQTWRRYWVCVHFTVEYVEPQIIVWYALGHSARQWVRWDLNPDSISWSPWLYRFFCSSVKFMYLFIYFWFLYGIVLFSLWWFISCYIAEFISFNTCYLVEFLGFHINPVTIK